MSVGKTCQKSRVITSPIALRARHKLKSGTNTNFTLLLLPDFSSTPDVIIKTVPQELRLLQTLDVDPSSYVFDTCP